MTLTAPRYAWTKRFPGDSRQPEPGPNKDDTAIRFPSGLIARELGYHAVGISPSIFAEAVSTTAMALMPPQATYNFVPSGEIAKAVGAIPATFCENGWIAIVR